MTYKEMCCEWLALWTGESYEWWFKQDDTFIKMNFNGWLEDSAI